MHIKIKDKKFKKFISNQEIKSKISLISNKINTEYVDKNPIFIAILDGSFMFAAELYSKITIPSEISFVKYKSYQGTSSGDVIENIGLNKKIKGRHVIIIEDIVDTGQTLNNFIKELEKHKIDSFKIASLFSKPNKHSIFVNYIGFEISDEFIVGFGLDYEEQGRNLPDVMQICD